ncbi:MAG: hypothetical protein ACJAWS_002646 [Oleiphilaceae bacterium]|jgi:hypothetical protein
MQGLGKLLNTPVTALLVESKEQGAVHDVLMSSGRTTLSNETRQPALNISV